jgi:hypothetical protein
VEHYYLKDVSLCKSCIYLFVLFFFETGFLYIAQAGLELVIFLPEPPKCWNCRHALRPPAVILGFLLGFITISISFVSCFYWVFNWKVHTYLTDESTLYQKLTRAIFGLSFAFLPVLFLLFCFLFLNIIKFCLVTSLSLFL